MVLSRAGEDEDGDIVPTEEVHRVCGFPLETLRCARVILESEREEFQCVYSFQHPVTCLVHLAHPAAAEQADNVVLAEGVAAVELFGHCGSVRMIVGVR